ncbi:20S_proteasome alpha subunit 4 [Hexamita inflata]|uniref:20S proteasome alpha subunit 4 n=1 Tax=Hexamita inflata TaxID=28002 RepID=A0AA86UT41_9EUKA|nr:20S proteasome alpha subunit 4 [Hexamita inflata]
MPYDSSLTVFSPEGHLIQVQYAHKAVARGTCAVGLASKHGIVLAVERKQTARLQDPRTNLKLFDIDEDLYATYSGLTADARQLIDKLRVEAQTHRLTYDQKPPVKIIAKQIANYMQQHTQSGGRRPFGVTLILAGKDENGYQIFTVDPSGVYCQFKGVAIGNQNPKIQEFLDKNYKEDMTIDELKKLGKDAVGQIVEDLEDGIDVRVWV